MADPSADALIAADRIESLDVFTSDRWTERRELTAHARNTIALALDAFVAHARAEERVKLEALFLLMDEADDALDKDTYNQKRKDEFDTPDDAEWRIRAGTEHKISKVFLEIDRIRRALPAPPTLEREG